MPEDPAAARSLVHLTISGRVQGVSYRVWMQNEAMVRGIVGWARNRTNGDVEAVLAGDTGAVHSLCELARSGPPSARVDQILIGDADQAALEADGTSTSFIILPTL